MDNMGICILLVDLQIRVEKASSGTANVKMTKGHLSSTNDPSAGMSLWPDGSSAR